jgi:hypothetical protein
VGYLTTAALTGTGFTRIRDLALKLPGR